MTACNEGCDMKYHCFVLAGAIAAVVVVASVSSAGQSESRESSPRSEAAPRTAWGDPDLQGTWRNMMTGRRLELPKGASPFLTDEEIAEVVQSQADVLVKATQGEYELAAERRLPLRNSAWYLLPEGEFERIQVSRRRAQIVDPPNGRVPPWTPQQFQLQMEREEVKRGRGSNQSWGDRGPNERCLDRVADATVGYYGLIRGLSRDDQQRVTEDEYQVQDGDLQLASFGSLGSGTNNSWQFVQAPGWVVIVEEGANQGRQSLIPLDGRSQLPDTIRQFTGSMRGRWEGETLVVEVTNINDQQNGGRYIPSQTTSLHPGSGLTLGVTKRYTRIGPNTLEIRTTITDPEVYVQPWTKVIELTLDNNFFAAGGQCQEGNTGMTGMLMAGKADERWMRAYAAAEQQNRLQRVEEMKAEWQDWDENR